MANIDTSKFVNLDNLQYYDQKIKKFTKKYTDNEIAKFDFIKVVSALPKKGEELENKIYLVPISVESGFPTAAPGVYEHGSNFTELLYSWDDIVDSDGIPHLWEENEGFIIAEIGINGSSIYGDCGGDVVFPNSVSKLFHFGCGNIVLPENFNRIDNGGCYTENFYGYVNSALNCKMEVLYSKASEPPIITGFKAPYLTKIVVPKGCGDAYKSATNWCDYASIIVEVGEVVDTKDQNLFDEWIWINKGTEESPEYDWEWITKKQVEIDLTEYATKDFVEQTLLNGTW